MTRRKPIEIPTAADIAWSSKSFGEAEPRAVFYRLSTWLMERALNGEPDFSESEALSVILLTWNLRFYVQRGRRFGEDDYRQLESLLKKHREALNDCRSRSIMTFDASDKQLVIDLFEDFFPVVGAAGVAKALHMRAPEFFPIWDSVIAPKAYGLYRRDAEAFVKLILLTMEQIHAAGQGVFSGNPVKQIDEWNYCRYSMGLSGPG